MTRLALLLHPSANRVYAESSIVLTEAELTILSGAVMAGRLHDVRVDALGGVPAITFVVDSLTERDLRHLANVSTAYALFAQEGELLRPLTLHRLDRYDDDLLTVLKYAGKTNETFTKLLLNVTVLASAAGSRMLTDRLRVLDPMCGRGTTLNQAVMYGWDAAGVDLDRKDVDAYAAFLRTWLKRKRIKHTVDAHPVRHAGHDPAHRVEALFASDKAAFQAGDRQRVDVVHADTVRAPEFFKPGSMDVVVTDAPYGVQHGSRSGAAGLSRRPLDLLGEAVPGWAGLLAPGGTLGIAWNTHVAARDDVSAVLADAGLDVVDEAGFGALRHRVDQAIDRDIVVARRPD
ncbi:MAG: SAM-dependent methyltransferase [Austwickia sp.]|nr:SAM-dependent methyltransferase [Austwickia sp.]